MSDKLTVITVFFATLAIVSDVTAQTGADDPVVAAAHYVLEQQKLIDLRGGLVVDIDHQIQGVGLLARPLSPEIRGRLNAIAVSFHGRAGALNDHLLCPENPPEAKAMARAYQGCRLIGGARTVLQVGPPEVEGNRAVVWVKTWTDMERGRSRFVSAVAREVELERDEGGLWWPLRVGLQSAARW